jgi:hypothetical protein
MDAGAVSVRVATRHKLLVGASPQIHVASERLSDPVAEDSKNVSPQNLRYLLSCGGDRWIPVRLDLARVSCL